VRVQYYAGTCNLQPITAYRPIDGISRLLTERGPDWQAWDVAPPMSLQLVTFIAAEIGGLNVAASRQAGTCVPSSILRLYQSTIGLQYIKVDCTVNPSQVCAA